MTESAENAKMKQTESNSPAPAALTAIAPDQAKGDTGQQLTFLYKALDDNQSLIRFLDAKAAFAVALLSAMIGRVLANLGAYFPWSEQSHWRQLLVLAFGVSATAAIILVSLIVFPTINPALNTSLLPPSGPLFFITQLSPKRWRRIFSRSPKYSHLVQDHSDYFSQITAADNLLLLRIVSGEVLKVSYIRQIKADRVKALAVPLVGCSILFAVLMVSDALIVKPVKPTLVHVDSPLKLDGAVSLSPTPSVPQPLAQPPNESAKAKKSASHTGK